MLRKGSNLYNFPVLSLHLGGQLGRIEKEIIDPNNLKIIGFILSGNQMNNGKYGDILDVNSVREYSTIGLIIDSIDEITSRGEIIKIDENIKLNFSPIGLRVRTKKGTKLGKVIDYNFNTADFEILQLVVKRPLVKAFLDSELIVGRSEIIEINDYEIIVKDEEEKIRQNTQSKDFIPNFINPFREQQVE